ncbi:MAG: tetratricopeptide repeat protein [Candidatus Sulfotelmatobacter sp.]
MNVSRPTRTERPRSTDPRSNDPRSADPRSEAPAARPPQRLSPRVLFLLSLGLSAFVFAVYARSLPFQFILDDHRFTADPRIQESGHVWEYFANYVWAQFPGGPPSFYRPLFILWMRLNFMLSALSPWGWHFLSILKHLSVAALLGLLAWKLLRDSLAALTAATLFALHPAHTESVSSVSVPDPLMSAAVLASLLLYLRYFDNPSPAAKDHRMQRKLTHDKRKSSREKSAARPSPLWLAASAAAYFAALLAKETAIVFPCVILALDLHMGQRRPNPGTRLSQTLRRILPFVCVTGLYLLMRANALSGKLGAATQHLPWTTLLLSWPSILCFYGKAMLWPVKSYSFADPILVEAFTVRGFLLPLLALAFAVAIMALGVLWAWRKSQRELSQPDAAGVESALIIGTTLLFPPLLLALNLNALNPGDFLHGRYTYLPLAGLMLLLATVVRLLQKQRFAALGFACALVIVSAGLTFAQENQWRDDSTVFTVAHQLAPRNAPVAQNLANVHLQAALQLDEQGRCPEALPVFEQVTQEYPQDWYAWAGLGDCYVQLRNLPKAEESLHRAAGLSHNSQVIQQWQELRAQMGLPPSAP